MAVSKSRQIKGLMVTDRTPVLDIRHNTDQGGINVKKYYIITWVVIFHFAFFTYSAVAQATNGPKMVLAEQVFDFKEVKEGQVLEHTFYVYNQGDQPLVIKKVVPG